MRYIIEPMLLAVDMDATREEFESFIDNLLEWKQWLANHSHEIYLLSATEDYLYDTGNFPDFSVIRALKEKYHSEEIDVTDVNKTIRMLIDKAKKIDDECDISDIDKTGYKMMNAPDNMDKRCDEFKESLILVLWYTYLLARQENSDHQAYIAFLKNISMKLRIKFFFDICCDEGIVRKSDELNIRCMSSLSEMCKDEQTPFILWKYAKKKNDVALGAEISACQYEKRDYFMDCNYDFNIQQSFFDDYKMTYQGNDGYTRSIISSVSMALAESRKNTYHPLREGKQSTKPQLVKCGYNAERRDCTRGVHTHYWKNKQRLLFANLGEHDDMEIANPCEE